MRIDWFVPWDESLDELVFPVHTSVISQNLLLTKLAENGVEIFMQNNKKQSSDESTDQVNNINFEIKCRK